MNNNDDSQDLIAEFLKNGGEIVKLRYASESVQKKASQKWNHRDKAIAGNKRSKELLDKEDKKEGLMIFSKPDRWRE